MLHVLAVGAIVPRKGYELLVTALAELRDLVVGKPAPEVEGTSVTGSPIRLGDYRGKVVLVVFWASWCGPCRQLTPTIERLAEQYAGKVKVGKLNTDDNQDVAIRYGINAIPQVLFFKGSDTPVHQEIGVLPETELVRLINQHQA